MYSMVPELLENVKMSTVNVSGAPPTIAHAMSLSTPEYSCLARFEAVTDCVDSVLASLALRGENRAVRILRLRHGLENGQKRTLEEVGRDLVSRVNVLDSCKFRLHANCPASLLTSIWPKSPIARRY